MASTVNAGWASGITMRKITYHSPAPSMRAASSISDGMFMMYWRMKNTPKGVTSHGTIRAQYVLIQPNSAIKRYSGIMITCCGITSTPRTVPTSSVLPVNERRARA